MDTLTITEDCTCYCTDPTCCGPWIALGGYDATNPTCPIHGDEDDQ